MLPLPQSKLENIRPLIEAFISEGNASERTSVEFVMEKLTAGYGLKIYPTYVDNVDNPKACIIFTLQPGTSTKETFLIIQFVYAAPEDRAKREVLEAFRTIIDEVGKRLPHDAVLGSSWVFRGAKAIDGFWKLLGFELQERLYVKLPFEKETKT